MTSAVARATMPLVRWSYMRAEAARQTCVCVAGEGRKKGYSYEYEYEYEYDGMGWDGLVEGRESASENTP